MGQTALYIGQGLIHDRMRYHIKNEYIMDYEPSVFWAETDNRNGIEAYLRSKLHPVFGERWPKVPHIPVDIPFEN